MTRSQVEDVWPLSPLQEGLLFHAAFDSDGPDVYQGQRLLDLDGPVDADLLRTSWVKVFQPRAGVYHSHDYPFWSFMRRYFDEYRALRQTIGWIEPFRLKGALGGARPRLRLAHDDAERRCPR